MEGGKCEGKILSWHAALAGLNDKQSVKRVFK